MTWRSCQLSIRLICQLRIQNACVRGGCHPGLDASEAVLASAKAGIGIEDINIELARKFGTDQVFEAPLKALIFDSVYDCLSLGYCHRSTCGWWTVWSSRRYHSAHEQWQDPERDWGRHLPRPLDVISTATGDVGYIAKTSYQDRYRILGSEIQWALATIQHPRPWTAISRWIRWYLRVFIRWSGARKTGQDSLC